MSSRRSPGPTIPCSIKIRTATSSESRTSGSARPRSVILRRSALTCSVTRADSRSRNSESLSNRSSSWCAPVTSSAALAISGMRGSGDAALGSSSHGRHHMSATRKSLVFGSRYNGRTVPSPSGCPVALATAPAATDAGGLRCRPGTVTAICSPSSSIEREPTIAVPACTSHPPAGSPSPSTRGNLIRYPSPATYRACVLLILAIHAPSGVAAITPARRESPRPAVIARSTSGPRPNTSWLPSESRMTWPDAVLTCAATGPV